MSRLLIRGWSISLFRHIAVGFLGVLWLALLTRQLTTAEVGTIIVATTIVGMVAPVLSAGSSYAFAHMIAAGRHSTSYLIAFALKTTVVMAAVVALLSYTTLLLLHGLTTPTAFSGVAVGLMALPFAIITAATASIHQGLMRFGMQGLLGASHFALYFLTLAFLTITTGLTFSGAVIAYLSTYIAAAAIGVLTSCLALREHSRPDTSSPPLRAVLHDTWSLAWPLFLSEALASIRLRLDVLVATALMGASLAAAIGTSGALANHLGLLSLAAFHVIMPLAAADRSSEPIGNDHPTLLALRVTWPLITAGAIALTFFAPQVLTLVYGDAFRNYWPVLVAYLPGTVFLSISRILTGHLAGRTATLLLVKLNTIATGASIVLIPLGALYLGAIGIGLGVSLTALISTALRLAAFTRLERFSSPSGFFPCRQDLMLLRNSLSRTPHNAASQ